MEKICKESLEKGWGPGASLWAH